jgi:hypothetical protein
MGFVTGTTVINYYFLFIHELGFFFVQVMIMLKKFWKDWEFKIS